LKPTICDLLPFYNKVVPHCRGYYVFVPPLSTLRSGLVMGTWFSALQHGIQLECLHHFSALLLTALCQKSIGLVGHPTLDFLATGTDDGYFAFYQLAQLGGHPLLNPYPMVVSEPTQGVDTDLATYLSTWIHYLTIQALSGQFLSDRYFIIKFVAGLHASLRVTLGVDLERHIDHPRYDNRPLPFDFTPAHLWVRLQQRAQFIGFCGQVLASPRDAQVRGPGHILPRNSSPMPVQQLVQPLPSDELNFDVDHFLAALTTAGNMVCFFCHNSSHTAQTCPLLLRTKSDPFAWRIVLRLLGDVPTSASRSSTQPHCHPGRPSTGPRVHAITTDDDAALFLSPAPDSSPDSDQALTSDPLPVLDPPDVPSDNDPDFYLAC